MTFHEALNILSLSPNYTEEELNSAYKKEAKLYHPDNYMNMDKQKQKWATMMMQKINKAREILKNHLKESKNNAQSNKYENRLNVAKNNATNEIDSFHLNKISSMQEFRNFEVDIITLYRNSLNKIMFAPTINECKKIVQEFKNALVKYYRNLLKGYFEYHNINYDSNIDIAKKYAKKPLDEYYRALNNFKNIYDKVMTIIDEFSLWGYYQELKDKIDILKNKALDTFWITDNISHDTIVLNLKEQIANVFKSYTEKKETYNKLVDLAQDIKNADIIEELKELEKLLTADNFYDYYQKVKEKIENYLKRIENSEELKKLYARVNTRLITVLRSLNPVSDYTSINRILSLYQAILKLIKKYDKGLIDFDVLKNLDKITFTKPIEDLNIITAIDRNTLVISSNNIYFRKDVFRDGIQLLVYQDGKYEMIYPNLFTIRKEEVTPSFIATNYISLDEFMARASEWFLDFKCSINSYRGLYQGSGLVLALNELDRFDLLDADVKISGIRYIEKEDIIMYKDREYIKSLIVEQLQKDFDRLENFDEAFKRTRNYNV